MANPEHLEILKSGVENWNEWRDDNPDLKPDLAEADLFCANLSEANLANAELIRANLSKADLIDANLSGANLIGADLSAAILGGADLRGAMLWRASLVETEMMEADLRGCLVYGASVWNVDLEGAKQSDLVITDLVEPTITVDNLEVAQFVHLLLNNKSLRSVIDTITSKAVLILGRFKKERKVVLDAIREELRDHDYLPILFDFDPPFSRDLTETISTLAHLARFVIADITDAKSIPQELMSIVPNLPSVPVRPILLASQREYAMFEYFRRYDWVLPEFLYEDQDHLLASLVTEIIEPAEAKVLELRPESPEKG